MVSVDPDAEGSIEAEEVELGSKKDREPDEGSFLGGDMETKGVDADRGGGGCSKILIDEKARFKFRSTRRDRLGG